MSGKPINITSHDGQAKVSPGEYLGAEFSAYLEATKTAGATYNAALKAQVCPLGLIPKVIECLKLAGFTPIVQTALADAIKAKAQAARGEIEAAKDRLAATDAELTTRGLSLFPFQRTGVAWLAGRERALLADEMGLGKTIQTLIALPNKAAAVVVCPASLKGNWAKEAAKWRPDLAVQIMAGRGRFAWPAPGQITITNYDILPDLDKPVQAFDPLFSEGLVCAQGTVLIPDEAHNLKTKQSLRRQRWNLLKKEVLSKAGKVWLLTGTPLLNDPRELWSILEAADLAGEAFGSWPRFLRLFHAQASRYGIEAWGKPEKEVPELLRRVMLHRTREEVLPDLPTKIWQSVDVHLDDTTKAFCDQVVAEMRAKGLDPDDVWMRVTEGKMGGDEGRTNGVAFERISAVRNALAIAKIPAMLELVETFEDSGEPLVVFSAHRPPVDKLGEREGWATITGDTPNEKRQGIVDAFQGGRLKGVALTIQAGGVGLTLTRAHQAIFVDLMWTPALNKQAEDRICRIGQTRGVIITTLVGDHDLDCRVAEKLREKQALIESSVEAARVINPEVKTVADELDAIKDVRTSDTPVTVRNGYHKSAPLLNGENHRPASNPVREDAQVGGYFRAPENETERWAMSGLLRVACLDPDHAASRNEVGFSRYDNEFGHSLADNLRQHGRLSSKQWACAVRLAIKYRRQIGEPPKTPEAA